MLTNLHVWAPISLSLSVARLTQLCSTLSSLPGLTRWPRHVFLVLMAKQRSKSPQVLSMLLLVSHLLTSHWPKQVIWPESRCVKVRQALQSYMAKDTGPERDKPLNETDQLGQRVLKIYPWLMTKKENESMNN